MKSNDEFQAYSAPRALIAMAFGMVTIMTVLDTRQTVDIFS